MVGTRHENRTASDAPWSSKLQSERDKTTRTAHNNLAKNLGNQLNEKGSSMQHVTSQNLYQDRRAWRTLFVNWQEFIFLPGDWLERGSVMEDTLAGSE